MKYNFTGKNIDVSEGFRQKIESKFARIEKLFPKDAEAQITLKSEKLDQIIEVSVPLKKRLLRAEVSTTDMNASIDEIIDVVERQMIKYKSKLRDRARNDVKYKEELNVLDFDAHDDDTESKVVKVKRFSLKPMDSEEAAMEMELLGHNFFVFRNGDTDLVNVVYKRKNGTYGLIEPE